MRCVFPTPPAVVLQLLFIWPDNYFSPLNNGISARSRLSLVVLPFNYCVNRYVIETKSIVPISALLHPSLPGAHPVRLEA